MFIAQLEYALDDSILTQRTLRLRIGAEDVTLFCNQVAAKLQSKAVVPGFRKGKAPLQRVVSHLWNEVSARTFEELKSSALEQVFQKLDAKDKPQIPPQVLDRDKLSMKQGQQLEFAVKYLIDPSAISSQSEQPEQQGAVLRGSEVNHPVTRGMGIPLGPELPAISASLPSSENRGSIWFPD